jgi:hypothetical protein
MLKHTPAQNQRKKTDKFPPTAVFVQKKTSTERAIFGIIEMNYNGDDETEEEDRFFAT